MEQSFQRLTANKIDNFWPSWVEMPKGHDYREDFFVYGYREESMNPFRTEGCGPEDNKVFWFPEILHNVPLVWLVLVWELYHFYFRSSFKKFKINDQLSCELVRVKTTKVVRAEWQGLWCEQWMPHPTHFSFGSYCSTVESMSKYWVSGKSIYPKWEQWKEQTS